MSRRDVPRGARHRGRGLHEAASAFGFPPLLAWGRGPSSGASLPPECSPVSFLAVTALLAAGVRGSRAPAAPPSSPEAPSSVSRDWPDFPLEVKGFRSLCGCVCAGGPWHPGCSTGGVGKPLEQGSLSGPPSGRLPLTGAAGASGAARGPRWLDSDLSSSGRGADQEPDPPALHQDRHRVPAVPVPERPFGIAPSGGDATVGGEARRYQEILGNCEGSRARDQGRCGA